MGVDFHTYIFELTNDIHVGNQFPNIYSPNSRDCLKSKPPEFVCSVELKSVLSLFYSFGSKIGKFLYF